MGNIPLVSVIMPVYNAEKFLSEAIDSVLAQSYGCWELILIDDGSKDCCPVICDDYAQSDPRIRVVHQQNRGASEARNAGLLLAKGEWVMFLDDDDIMLPHCMETLLNNSHQADMVVCAYEEFPDRKVRRCTDAVREYASREKIAADFLQLRRNGFFNPQWNKLYKRDCLGARFDKTKDGSEDVFFSLSYLQRAKKIRVIPDILYRYRLIKGSPSLGSRFIMHFPQITEQTWDAFDDFFHGNRTVMEVIAQDMRIQLIAWVVTLVQKVNLPREQKMMLIELNLGDQLTCKKKLGSPHGNLRRMLLWHTIRSGKQRWIYRAAQIFK